MGVIKQENTMTNLSKIEQEILSQAIPTSKAVIDLGTEINAEMYTTVTATVSVTETEYISAEHSHSSDDVNVEEASPPLLASPVASRPVVRENQAERSYGRKISKDDVITDICCVIGKVRTGDRYQRMTAYLSIQTDRDSRYMIFMRSSLTTAHDEIIRSCVKYDNLPLRDICKDYIKSGKEVLIGRVRYKPVNGFIAEQHRPNLKHALLAVWINDHGTLSGEFYLNGIYYPLLFSTELTAAQKRSDYKFIGHYHNEDRGEIE